MIRKSGFLQPSYQQGYARTLADSAYPEWFRHLHFAFMPQLGISGDVAYDISTRKLNSFPGGSNNPTWQFDDQGSHLAWDATDDYIDVVSSALTAPSTRSFTMAAFVRHNNILANNAIFGTRILGVANTARTGFYISTDTNGTNDRLEFTATDSAGVERSVHTGSNGLNAGNPVLWVCTRNGTNLAIYRDGLQWDAGSYSLGDVSGNLDSNDGARIGNRPASTARSFDGDIYGMLFWLDRAFSAAEVARFDSILLPFIQKKRVKPKSAAAGIITLEQIERHYPRGVLRGVQRGVA